MTWTDHVAYDCAANQRARTLHETKTNMTITYLNWYDGDGRAGNIQPFFERYVCDIFAAGGGASCPTYAYPWFTRGMRATNEGPAPCAAGTCTAWTVDNGILTYLFDSSGTIVRAEKREAGALIETYDYADLKAEAPPEWLFHARTPTDNATCLDFSAASPPSPRRRRRRRPRPGGLSGDGGERPEERAARAPRSPRRASGGGRRLPPSTARRGPTSSIARQTVVPPGALLQPSAPRRPARAAAPPIAARDLPATFDARTAFPGCIGGIQDQKGCGSCWAFGATEALHDRLCIANVSNVSLSAQWLVACEPDQSGCGGGFADNTRHYLQGHGTVSDACLPYSDQPSTVACTGRCADGSSPTTYYKAAGSQDPGTAEEAIMGEILARGPVSAAFYVFSDFMHYAGGVYARTGGSHLVGGHMIKVRGIRRASRRAFRHIPDIPHI